MKFCVIGLGRFGYQVAVTLADNGMEVLSIDSNEELIASIRDKVTQAVCLKVTDVESLRAVGVDEMDTVIVAMGESFAQSILITVLLKKHLKIAQVIARANDRIHEDILELVGADQVVLPERDMGIRLANNLSLPFVDLVNVTEKFAITQLAAPSSFIGKTIAELQLRKKRNIMVIGVKKGDDIILVNQEYVIMEHDQLVLAGENKFLAAVAHL